MVTLKRITQAEDEAFRKLTALYTEAFPVEERREIGQLGELLHTEPAMYFNAVEFRKFLLPRTFGCFC